MSTSIITESIMKIIHYKPHLTNKKTQKRLTVQIEILVSAGEISHKPLKLPLTLQRVFKDVWFVLQGQH